LGNNYVQYLEYPSKLKVTIQLFESDQNTTFKNRYNQMTKNIQNKNISHSRTMVLNLLGWRWKIVAWPPSWIWWVGGWE
jgi:hypothetical protein